MKKNRILSITFALTLCISLLVGCGAASSNTGGDHGKLRIVCTTFPQYDWVRELLGEVQDHYELTLLLSNGTDLHNYQPTAADIATIGAADLFIYVGGESDSWVEDALKASTNQDRVVINLLAELGEAAKTEEIVEGMEEESHDHDAEEQGEESHDHDAEEQGEESHDHESEEQGEESHDHEEEAEYDEHIWLSLKNAKTLVQRISEELQKIAAEDAQTIEDNRLDYMKSLEGLDLAYQQMVESAAFDTVLFGDRFPFRYLVDDYKLNYYAAFVGCSAETEASFETITFLAGKVDELKLTTILVIEGSNHKIAETIQQNTVTKTQQILELNSIQSITQTEIDEGFTYLDAMKNNLDVLTKALN